jgi:hypothetical protein
MALTNELFITVGSSPASSTPFVTILKPDFSLKPCGSLLDDAKMQNACEGHCYNPINAAHNQKCLSVTVKLTIFTVSYGRLVVPARYKKPCSKVPPETALIELKGERSCGK